MGKINSYAILNSSSFFPAEWTPDYVVKKVQESLGNTVEIFYETGARYHHLGVTSEGIPISAVIEVGPDIANVITAYPNFKFYSLPLMDQDNDKEDRN